MNELNPSTKDSGASIELLVRTADGREYGMKLAGEVVEKFLALPECQTFEDFEIRKHRFSKSVKWLAAGMMNSKDTNSLPCFDQTRAFEDSANNPFRTKELDETLRWKYDTAIADGWACIDREVEECEARTNEKPQTAPDVGEVEE